MTPTQIPSFRYQFTPSFQFFPHWRRGRDSNPRWPLSHNGFQDRRDRPLCHPSGLHGWQGGRDSNPQPTVLETVTLPIELPPFCRSTPDVSSCCPFNLIDSIDALTIQRFNALTFQGFTALRGDLGDSARTNGPAAFANRESLPALHRHRCDYLYPHRHIVARHHHLHA